MQVTELHRYPLKSMLGESLQSVAVGPLGFAGDRAWALRKGGTTLSGKKFPALMSAQAGFDAEPTVAHGSATATIKLPNGMRISTADSAASAQLSEWLSEEVQLWPLVGADDLEFFRRKASGAVTPEQAEQELRALFSRLPEEPLPDLMSFPAEVLEYDSPPGTYFDAYPILLVSAKALATLQNKATNNFDMRRFRPNIVVDDVSIDGLAPELSDEGEANAEFPENDLVGKLCRLGDVVLSIEMNCPRCIMTTHAFADVPKDPGIMRALVAHNAGNLGVYARVIQPGTIRQGDTLVIERNSTHIRDMR